MRYQGYIAIIGMVFAVGLIAGCLGGDVGSSADDIVYVSAGANGLSSSYIDLTDFEGSTHMEAHASLDKGESAEEHVFYLYLFAGDGPDTSGVGLDGLQAALEAEALDEFMMSWDSSEVVLEADIDTDQYDQYTITMWNPDRDDYTDDTPDAYVDVEIYFS